MLETILSCLVGKEYVQGSAKTIIDACNEGEVNTLELLAKMKVMATTFDAVRDAIMPLAIKEVAKHGKEVRVYGCTFQIAEAGIKYDYTKCGDETWLCLKRQELTVADERKRREKLLQRTMNRFDFDAHVVDEDTGEVIEVSEPPTKTSTTIVQVKL